MRIFIVKYTDRIEIELHNLNAGTHFILKTQSFEDYSEADTFARRYAFDVSNIIGDCDVIAIAGRD